MHHKIELTATTGWECSCSRVPLGTALQAHIRAIELVGDTFGPCDCLDPCMDGHDARDRCREALDELVRLTEETGLYDAHLRQWSRTQKEQP